MLLESSQNIYDVASDLKKKTPPPMSIVGGVKSWADVGQYFTETLVDGAPSILAVLGPTAKFKTSCLTSFILSFVAPCIFFHV